MDVHCYTILPLHSALGLVGLVGLVGGLGVVGLVGLVGVLGLVGLVGLGRCVESCGSVGYIWSAPCSELASRRFLSETASETSVISGQRVCYWTAVALMKNL